MGQERQEVFFSRCGEHGWQAGEHVAQIDPGIVAVTLAGGQEAEVDRCGTATTVAARRKPTKPSKAVVANRVFAFVVVDV